jgi:hypothetical protein
MTLSSRLDPVETLLGSGPICELQGVNTSRRASSLVSSGKLSRWECERSLSHRRLKGPCAFAQRCNLDGKLR